MADILLSELTNADIDWLAEAGQQQTFTQGDRISMSEAQNDTFYLLLDGRLAVFSADAPDPDTQVNSAVEITQFSSGEVIGTAALFDIQAPQIDFRAVKDSILLAVPMNRLKAKLQSDLMFAANFYRAIDLILSYRVEHLIEDPAKLRFGERQVTRDVLDVFAELRDSDLNWLVKAGRVERYAPDDFLLKAGRPTDFLYIILDGAFSVALPENKLNPLVLCFECPIQNAAKMPIVNVLSKGEIAGAIAFLDARPIPVTIRAKRKSLVLAIPRTTFNLHIQQDLGFATRFYRILGPQLLSFAMGAMALRGVKPSYQSTRGMDEEIEYEGELDLDSLQRMTNGANRFNWMLSHLGVGVS